MPTCSVTPGPPMLDEANLRRLAQMGIDVYLPRRPTLAMPARGAEVVVASAQTVAPIAKSSAGAHAVVLVADARSGGRFLADVARALAFAGVGSARICAPDWTALDSAGVVIAFGEVHARAAAALLSAQRQQQVDWIVTGEFAELAGNAQRKRALWTEVKGILRMLSARPSAEAGGADAGGFIGPGVRNAAPARA